LSENNVPANLKDFAFGNSAGAVMGPIFENDTYTMARVVETGIMQSDSVKLRHIYLVSKDEAKTDSIVAAIKGGANFAELAQKFSAVQQTAANGGEIGWIFDGIQGVTKEMSTKAFASGTNEIFTLKDAQGTQIMQVMEKTPARRKVRLAILDIKVNTSNVTVSKIYNQAKQFAAELNASDFEKRATESKYEVRLASDLLATTEKIADLSNSRQIIRWSFENDKGDVSDVYDCGNDFVVATITDKGEKGYRSIEKVTDALKAEIIRDKKAEIITKNIAEKTSKNPSIEGLAMAMGLEVKSAPAVNFDAYQFGAAGPEPSVIGKVSKLSPNKISAPIKGNAGVYVVTTSNPQQNPAPFDAKMQVMMMNARTSYSLPYMITQNLRDKSDLVDNRLTFY
jgi:peptidyl-prolyl cis-trans isomerase D